MRKLDHVGIAVRSIEERLQVYRALGVEVSAIEDVPSQKVRVAFLPLEGTRIELIEPNDPSSPISAFLEKRGEGIHHLCFRVADLRATMARLREHGMQLLSQEPIAGADGALVCFVHPKSAGGVLIELSQPVDGDAP